MLPHASWILVIDLPGTGAPWRDFSRGGSRNSEYVVAIEISVTLGVEPGPAALNGFTFEELYPIERAVC